ncbi:helix-turn-helix domain-containing protein [Nocardiopsis chromatogenes]|uniref:helix-turn-helix domain-containing protein n=1 Tax=Nocardiopsis chromatogenes TaxID=280239 RepID=UPI00037C4D6D|nr:helix-turn-helix transcriptional regulator [Nocardiopsis chromatogenes]
MESARTQGARSRLASLLRTARLDRGLSGHELARDLGWSQSKVSKIENGRTRPSVGDVEQWLDACRVPLNVREQAAELTEAALVESRHWRAVHAQGLKERQQQVGALEERSSEVLSFQPSLVPGLLQTAEYARQVLTLADASTTKDVPAAVAARMQRQEVLYRTDKRFCFVITEAALRWHPFDASLLSAQTDRLLAVSTLSNVELRVLTLAHGFGQRQNNGFLLYESADDSTVIVETFTRELVITEPDEVDQYRSIHAVLREHALTEADSRTFIADVAAALP